MKNIGCVILSGGDSSRMGTPKATLQLGRGTFLQRILDNVLAGGFDPVRVILGKHHSLILDAVPGAEPYAIKNNNSDAGQLYSLQLGLLDISHQCTAVLMCLVDHPLVMAKTYRALAQKFRDGGSDIIIPTCQGKRGHPVLFGENTFSELLTAPLDQGARTVVRKDADRVFHLEVDDPGILKDIDTQEEYGGITNNES